MDCIFCRVVSGEIPNDKLGENEGAIAFLDISPLSKGHSLVIPKKHYEKFHEMDDKSAKSVIILAKKVAVALNIENYNLIQNNGKLAHQAVPHVHFHIIPRTEDHGLKIDWVPHENSNHLKTLAEKISKDMPE